MSDRAGEVILNPGLEIENGLLVTTCKNCDTTHLHVYILIKVMHSFPPWNEWEFLTEDCRPSTYITPFVSQCGMMGEDKL